MRSLLRAPLFTLTVLFTLALGIGANTAIFTVVNAVLLRPLPYPEPEQLVSIGSKSPRRMGTEVGPVSYPDFEDFRKRSQSFQGMALFQGERVAFQTNSGEVVSLIAKVTSASLFDVLRVPMALGRGFQAKDDEAGKGQKVVLSHAAWQRLFAGASDIVGRAVVMNGRPWTVSGVLPPSFQFPFEADQAEIWMPMGLQRINPDGSKAWTEERGSHSSFVVGRLKSGVQAATGSAELENIAAALAKEYPETNTAFSAAALPLADDVVKDVRPALLVLFGAVACVLLIACANVANLSLVRAAGQRRELAIRAALGAGRKTLIRGMLFESIVLAIAGGLAGLVLARLGTTALLSLVPDSVPRAAEIGVDWTALLFTLGVSLVTGIGFGLAPAWQASRVDVNDALKDGGRGVSGGRHQARLRHLLVGAQIVASLVLLVGAGLMLRSFDRLLRQDPGYDLKRLATFRLNLPDTDFPKSEQVAEFTGRLLESLRARPEIEAATTTQAIPLSGSNSRTDVDIEGQEKPKGSRPAETVRVVSDDYFKALGLTVQGREFGRTETFTSPQVALVNQSFVRRYFPAGNALGKRIQPGMSAGDGEPPWREIVGVVPDVRQSNLSKEPEPEMYLSHAQLPWGFFGVMLRARNDPRSAINAAKQELARLKSDVPMFRVVTMDAYVERAAASRKFNGLLLGVFSGVALLLTAVGVYGVIAHTVALRRGEIGVRLALGATSGNILSMVLRQALILTSIAVAIGLVTALAATRLIGSLLYGVSALDPMTFAVVAVSIFAVAVLASLIPAVRAARTQPVEVLRAD